MDIQIRLAKPEDTADILELQARSIRTLSQDYNAKQIESLIRSQKSQRFINEIIFVAQRNNRLVGFASLCIHTPQIGAMFVHPDFMRQGIGTKLLMAIEEAAIEKRYKIIYVMSSLSAVNFYRSMDYEITRQSGLLLEIDNWLPCTDLQKQLIPFTEVEKWMRQITLLMICLAAIFWIVAILL